MNYLKFKEIWADKKLKLVVQNEEADNGLACLTMVFNFFGSSFDLGTLRRRFPEAGREGFNFKELIRYSQALDYDCQMVKVDAEKVKFLNTPAVIHWANNECVVLEKVKNRHVVLYSPRGQIGKISLSQFKKSFSGAALEFKPRQKFELSTKKVPVLKFSDLLGRTKGLAESIWLLVGVSLGLMALNLILPYYSILMMDDVIASRDLSIVNSLLGAAAVIVLLQGITEYLRDRVVTYLGGQFNLQNNSILINHLLRLPMSYFESRHSGVIISRVNGMSEIKKVLTDDLIETVIDSFIMLSTIVLLLLYCWQLSAIAMGSVALYSAIRIYFYTAMKKYAKATIESNADEYATNLETIRGIQSIKLYTTEGQRLKAWSRIFSKELGSGVKTGKALSNYTVINQIIFGLDNVIILYVGSQMVIGGGLTVGVLVAFLGQKTKFVQTFANVVEKILAFKMLDLDLERIGDILQNEPEQLRSESKGLQLEGGLEIRSLSFRYSDKSPYLFHNLNLKVSPGESIAITGESGGGKSTLVKIMLGLLEPQSGQILADGKSIDQIMLAYRKNISTVMQNDSILSGSISNNICFFDDSPDVNWMQFCAEAANVGEEIRDMPMQFETLISEHSNSISGGQKQRILLARALYRRPKILFLDEATSALDTENESIINMRLQHIGITRIIIAHRPETIRSADKVYKLSGGTLIESDEYVVDGKKEYAELDGVI